MGQGSDAGEGDRPIDRTLFAPVTRKDTTTAGYRQWLAKHEAKKKARAEREADTAMDADDRAEVEAAAGGGVGEAGSEDDEMALDDGAARAACQAETAASTERGDGHRAMRSGGIEGSDSD